jgi:hypothetical protein
MDFILCSFIHFLKKIYDYLFESPKLLTFNLCISCLSFKLWQSGVTKNEAKFSTPFEVPLYVRIVPLPLILCESGGFDPIG